MLQFTLTKFQNYHIILRVNTEAPHTQLSRATHSVNVTGQLSSLTLNQVRNARTLERFYFSMHTPKRTRYSERITWLQTSVSSSGIPTLSTELRRRFQYIYSDNNTLCMTTEPYRILRTNIVFLDTVLWLLFHVNHITVRPRILTRRTCCVKSLLFLRSLNFNGRF